MATEKYNKGKLQVNKDRVTYTHVIRRRRTVGRRTLSLGAYRLKMDRDGKECNNGGLSRRRTHMPKDFELKR